MKISIITGRELKHPEVKILCKEKNKEVIRIEQILSTIEQCVIANCDDKDVKILFADILYFEMVDRNVYAYTRDIVAKVSGTLSSYSEEKFYGYIRISKSVVLNVIHVKNLERLLNGNMDVTMVNEEHIIVARRYVSDFITFLKKGGNKNYDRFRWIVNCVIADYCSADGISPLCADWAVDFCIGSRGKSRAV